MVASNISPTSPLVKCLSVTFAYLFFLFQSDDDQTENFKSSSFSLSLSYCREEGHVSQVRVWRSEDNSVKPVLSVHLYMGSKD